MLKYRNFGKQSLKEITEILSGMGLGLGMDIDALLGGRAAKPAAPAAPASEESEIAVENG
jgi:hypothetical protein